MLALVPLILQLVQAGLTVAPELISAAQTEISLVTAVSPPTADQQAQIDAGLAAANAALQAAQPAGQDQPAAQDQTLAQKQGTTAPARGLG